MNRVQLVLGIIVIALIRLTPAQAVVPWDNGPFDGRMGLSELGGVDVPSRYIFDDFFTYDGGRDRLNRIRYLVVYSRTPMAAYDVEIIFFPTVFTNRLQPDLQNPVYPRICSFTQQLTGQEAFNRPIVEVTAEFDDLVLEPGRYFVATRLIAGAENVFHLSAETQLEPVSVLYERQGFLRPGRELYKGVDYGMTFILDADATSCSFQLSVDQLIGGETSQFGVVGARPNEMAYLVYTLAGRGQTYVPQLNVTLDLTRPQQAGSPIRTSGKGAGEWSLTIPEQASGRTVWFQAVQYEQASNVIESAVQ